MTDEPRPLRAVFLDIGDTVMRPNPSWEAVYAIAFREFGVEVDIGELYAALRKAYHHGGWGIDDVGFEPTRSRASSAPSRSTPPRSPSSGWCRCPRRSTAGWVSCSW